MLDNSLKGSAAAAGYRFAIVVSRFNDEITSGLLDGALETLAAAGVAGADVTTVEVPGAFEIPLTAKRLAESKRFHGVICLGCLIKGDTMHFEYIASATSHGIMDAGLATGVPIAFGVLTTLTDEQAAIRAAAGAGNKGREAALAAIEMATLFAAIDGAVRP
jgi:6,7-dimethyl-8-ribityllumazine synthase